MMRRNILFALFSTLLLLSCGDSGSDGDWIVGSWKVAGPAGAVVTFSDNGTMISEKDAAKNRSALPYTLNGDILTWSEHKSDTKIMEYKMKINSRSANSFSGVMVGFPMALEYTRVPSP